MKDRKEYLKAYYQDHKEEAKAKNKAYYEANKEKLNARSRAYHEANKERESVRSKAYHEANKEKRNACSRAYHQADKERASARSKAYHEANKEKLNARSRAYHEANKEKLNARSRAYGANNRDKCNALSAKKRAVKSQALLPSSDLKLIKNLYKQRADTSKKHGEEYHVDHIIPLSIGGAHHQDNMRIITAKENLEKHDEYIPELGGVWADNDLARKTKKKLGIK